MDRDRFYELIKKVPKAEIHLHIEAVPTINSIKALYKKVNGVEITDSEIKDLFTYEDLNGFIQAFLKIQALYKSEEDFDYIFDDLASYLSENGIVYTEAFFAPTGFLRNGFKYENMVKVFDKKIAEIKEKYGITVKLLMDVSRTFGLENAMHNYELLKQFPSKNIIGIGLGGAESKGPCRDYQAVFELAKKEGYKVVAHAGEDVGPESVWEAIDLLHVDRVGHCISSIQDEKLMQVLKERGIVLEVCPTSNVFTKKYVKSIAEHPIRAFFERGLFVTVNTDDPVFFKVTLIDELYKLHTEAGFSMDEIKTLIKNGFKATYLSDSKKESWYKKIDKEFAGA
ncbi:MAG: adenosine deaminase [Treponema sp.]|jgi:adenosine deaminase|nr:adenosine deaminase [Treponema sp.]